MKVQFKREVNGGIHEAELYIARQFTTPTTISPNSPRHSASSRTRAAGLASAVLL